MGAGPSAPVEFLQSPSNPASCFRCTKLKLVFRPDGHVFIDHEKSGKNVQELKSQAPRSDSPALCRWGQAAVRLESSSLTAPCTISLTGTHAAWAFTLAGQDQGTVFLACCRNCTAHSLPLSRLHVNNFPFLGTAFL